MKSANHFNLVISFIAQVGLMPAAIDQAMAAQGNYTNCRKYRFSSEGSGGIHLKLKNNQYNRFKMMMTIARNRVKMTTISMIRREERDRLLPILH